MCSITGTVMRVKLAKSDKSIQSVRIFFVLVFIYPIITGLLLQLLILPHILPGWHAGNGILVGSDTSEFHQLAVSLSEKIRVEGWQAWTPQPGGQIVAGIAAIFYTLITPQPWALLPFNALLHTIAAWALFDILRNITGDWKKAIVGSAFFAFFPSSLTWTAQMHNDSYAILGGMLFISGWASLARRTSWNHVWVVVRSIFLILIGSGLLLLVRPYMLTMMRGLGGIISIVVIIVFLKSSLMKQIHWWKIGTAILFFMLISFASTQKTEFSTGSPPRITPPSWKSTAWLPGYVDRQLKSLSTTRSDVIFRWQHAASNIDTDVTFSSATEVILYLPRAAQIAFLSPFPADWFGTGSKAPNTMMRRVSAVEMLLVYAALLGLPYFIWQKRKQVELWVVLFFCTGMLVIYALGVPNVGTLYRFRYVYLMTMVGLGAAGWLMLYEYWSTRRILKGKRFESTPVC
jgi:hypothetical protein